MANPTLPPQAYTREMLSQAYSWLQTQNEAVKKLATNSDALVALYMRYLRHGNLGITSRTPESESLALEVNGEQPPKRGQPSASGAQFRDEMRNLANSLQPPVPRSPEIQPPLAMLVPDIDHEPNPETSYSNVYQHMHPSSNEHHGFNSAPTSGGTHPSQVRGQATAFAQAASSVATHGFAMQPQAHPGAAQQGAAGQMPNVNANANANANSASSISINLLNVQSPSGGAGAPYPGTHGVPQGPTPNPTFPVSLEGKTLQQVLRVQASLNLSTQIEACRMLIAIGYEQLKPILQLEEDEA